VSRERTPFEGGNMRIKFTSIVVLLLLSLSTYSHAGDIDSTLNKAKEEGKIVMLELGSIGCIPCEQMKPVMAKLSDIYKGKLDVIFIDVKKDHDMARRFGVYMIPVQVFLNKDGKEFHRHVGYYPYNEIASVLKKAGI
jgi:thioredoxin